jgi:hypothetical protein
MAEIYAIFARRNSAAGTLDGAAESSFNTLITLISTNFP